MTSIYRPSGGQAKEPYRFADPLPPQQQQPLPTPNSRNSVVVSGGRVSPYQSPAGNRPFEGTMRPEVPTNMSAYSPPSTPSRSAGMRWNGSQWSTPSTNRSQSQPKASSDFGGGYDPFSRMQTLGGAFNDPRWRHSGGHWGDSRMTAPGQAQPIQPPDPGTAYDPQGSAGSSFAAAQPSPGQAWQVRGADSPSAKTFLGGQSSAGRFNPQPSSSFSGDPRGGFASQPADNRPPPFAMGLARTPWGQTADPFGERMAMVEQMQNQNMMRQIAFNNGGMSPPPTWGMAPRLDPRRALADAGLASGSPTMWR